MKKYILLLVITSFIWISCRGPQYYIKEAKKYEKARNWDQATAHYAEAYALAPNNNDAKKGFKKAGQRLLNELVEDMESSLTKGDFKSALEQQKKINRYFSNVKSRGIELKMPSNIDSLMNVTKESFLLQQEDKAFIAINQGLYKVANEALSDIRSNDPFRPSISKIENAIKAEPIYRDGINAFDKNQKFSALQYFKQVETIYPGYRDTKTYMDKLISTTKQKLVLFPIENTSKELNLDALLYKVLDKKFMTLQSELVSYADQLLVQNELLKLKKPTSPPFDDATTINVSTTLMGTKSITLSLIELREEKLDNLEQLVIAYVKEKVIYNDPYYGQMTNYQYRETKYRDVEEGTRYTIYLKMKIIDISNNTILYNDILTKSIVNKLKYARYDGDYNDLTPTTGYISTNDLNIWRKRFAAERDKKSRAELIDLVLNSTADEIYNIVLNKLIQ